MKSANSEGRRASKAGRTLYSSVSAAALIALGVLAALPAQAQDAVADDGLALEEVVVTARKREESLQAVPVTVSAVSGDTLTNKGLTTVTQLTQLVPSLTFTSYAGVPSVSMRGSANRLNGSPGVGFFTDGVFTAATSQFNHGPLDVARIEVLQGPQGTIYGRNTIAGAINFVTNDPTPDFEGSVAAGYGGSSQSGDSLWHAQAVLSGPLAPNLEGRIAYRHNERDGYLYDPTSGVRLGFTDGDYVRGKLKWTPTDTLTVKLTGEYSETSEPRFETLGFFPGGSYVHQGSVPLPVFFSGISGGFYEIRQDPRYLPYAKTKLKRVYLEVSQETPLGVLTSETSYAHSKLNARQDIDFIAPRLAEQYNVQNDHSYTQELRLAGSADGWAWIGGLFYLNQQSEMGVRAPFYAPGRLNQAGVAEQFYRFDQQLSAYAVFGQLDYDVTDKLKVTLGGRWSRDEKRSPFAGYVRTTSGVTAVFPRLDRDEAWNSTTYLINARYQWTDDVMTYVSRSTGFKAGGFQNLANAAVAAIPFDPEKVTQTEVGLKSELFDRRVRLNLAAYHLKYDDLQVQNVRVTPTVLTFIDNAAGAKVEGIDVEIKALVTRDLTLTVAETFTPTAKIVGFSTIAGSPNIEGLRIQRTSRHAFNVSLDYRTLLENDIELRLGTAYTYRSKFVNEVDASRKPDGSFATIPLPGYGLVSVNASVSRGPWQLEAYVRNLTDKKYFASAANLGGGALYPGLTHGEPRTWEVTLTYKFN